MTRSASIQSCPEVGFDSVLSRGRLRFSLHQRSASIQSSPEVGFEPNWSSFLFVAALVQRSPTIASSRPPSAREIAAFLRLSRGARSRRRLMLGRWAAPCLMPLSPRFGYSVWSKFLEERFQVILSERSPTIRSLPEVGLDSVLTRGRLRLRLS